ncbi:hypothetical protein N7468_001528 [Penicillium chermesinum]|uniref:Uncharacterized protein n=1 Tax=Penicillium chermesinum TaxID=63820 RepID=A0A9W9PGT7_9EURO|nr:uncharacterized protein N7468_001528 [Penicillium chermesinum]KAJ5246545.1 hypothetical protein N7468_001528 [Penicillium chermesinum]KAJ6144813.1 hypothetical protein N7470_008708 [Penicillium chermesinum]
MKADRRSDSSYDGEVEEARVALKTDPKTLQQLSSSSDAVKAKRNKNGLASLENAIKQAKQEEVENSKKKNGKK